MTSEDRERAAANPDYRQMFSKGKNMQWMNALWEEMRKRGFVKLDKILRKTGVWGPIDPRKLLKRLVTMAHGKLRSEPPNGYRSTLYHCNKHPELLAYLGDNPRREFSKLYPDTPMPKRLLIGPQPGPRAPPKPKKPKAPPAPPKKETPIKRLPKDLWPVYGPTN